MTETSAAVLPRPVPVRVPWEISPSTPFLQVSTAECGGGTEVTAVAHFGLEHGLSSPTTRGDGLSTSIKIVRPPQVVADDQTLASGPYQLIRIRFESGLWVRFSPSFSDSEVVEEAAYDWSAITTRYQAGQGFDEYKRMFWEQWRRSALCPDPNMYELERSPWLFEVLPGHHEYKHFLILGHDAYVEVLARGWAWKSLRSLPDF